MFLGKSVRPLLFLRQKRNFRQYLDVHPQIEQSLLEKKPLVALESTIITHGMPYPQNLETALEVEQQVRDNGAEPATIAILDGRLKVGLSGEDLLSLASKSRQEVIKCSRRDMAYAIASQLTAGTTVAATMIIAHMAGINIFATGGVGGVHRDGHISMDVSADLVELGRTPVTVVCSGVKSILDIPRTLEYLETQGVCVATFGEHIKSFPDFYTRDSGHQVPYNLQNAQSAAKLIKSMHELQLNSGILIGVPVPEAFAADKQQITAAIDEAYVEANKQGITGKEVTPFMLAAIAKITKGNSLAANMALIKNNAAVAAQIAQQMSQLETKPSSRVFHVAADTVKQQQINPKSAVLTPFVIGASILDLSLTMYDDIPMPLDGATYHTKAKQSAGGVARNIAECLHKLHGSAKFLSMVGNDELGRSLLQLMPSELQKGVHICSDKATSLCSLLFDRNGDCKLILGNMEIHETISPALVQQHEAELAATPLIVMDANLPVNTIASILQLAQKHNKPVFFEPTDMRIANKPFSLKRSLTNQIKIISPNFQELRSIVQAFTNKAQPEPSHLLQELLSQTKDMLSQIQQHFDCILVTLGQHGSVLCWRAAADANVKTPLFDAAGNYCLAQTADRCSNYFTKHFAAPQVGQIKNVSGAGDSYSSGFITGLLRGYDMERAVALGSLAAARSLMSESAVPQQYFKHSSEESELLEGALHRLKQMSI